MSISIKLSTGASKSVTVEDFNIDVAALKEKISAIVEIPADQQRIVFKGKVLKDGDSLSKSGMEAGCAIHVVKGQKSTSSAPTPTPAATTSAPPPAALATQPTPAAPTAAANPYASLFGGAGGFGAPAPQAGAAPAWGGLGGFGGMGAPGMMGGMNDPMMAAMLNDPMAQQMMMQMMQNPQVMQQALAMNPMFQGMNQQQREEMATMLSNPQVIQQAMAMMRGGGLGGGAFGRPQAGAAAPQPGQGVGAVPNFGGFNPFGAMQQPVGEPREIYREQLEQLRAMGFPNEAANIAALQQSGGSVEFAIERLLNA